MQPERWRVLLDLTADERARFLARLSDSEREEFRWHWDLWARPGQRPPTGNWQVWLICAGRGFGKTRTGAEWVRMMARGNPDARIALIGASLPEVRAVMVEGESGILATAPPHRRPLFEPSLRRLTWPNGAQAMLYSAAEPDTLRGPQHSHACRAIAEGIHCQRGASASRRASPLRHRGSKRDAPGIACGRRMLARRSRSDRGLVRACRRDCMPPSRGLVVPDAP